LVIEDTTKDIFNWRHRAFLQLFKGIEVDEETYGDCYSEANEFKDG